LGERSELSKLAENTIYDTINSIGFKKN